MVRQEFATRFIRAFRIWACMSVFAAVLCSCAQKAPVPPHALAYLAQSNGYWKIWVADVDGSNAKELPTGDGDVSHISWYPGGRELLVNLQDGRLFRINVQTGQASAIQAPMPGIQDAVISPDGKRIGFSYGPSESIYNNDVWVFDIASGAPSKLTAMPGLQHEPAWSSDGQWLYFLSGTGEQFHDIWRLNLATHSREQITVNELYHFDLAPNSKGVIAYSGNRSGNYDLWLRYPDGRTEQLTNDVALDARPTWMPDQSALLFESTREGGLNLWKIDLATKALARITRSKDGARMPVIASGAEP